MDALVNAKLLAAFLKKSNVPIAQAEIDEAIEKTKKDLERQRVTLEDVLANENLTMPEFKDRTTTTLQWHRYLTQKATDGTLKAYFDKNKDIFDNSQVRASHILIRLEPTASAADIEKAKKKLEGIREEIVSGKITFADAANKYSEDDMGDTKNGGDLSYFNRRGKYLDEFSDAAFALRKGEISKPILTEYGWHLIQVTDQRAGGPVEFKAIRERVMAQYAYDLQDQSVALMKKDAKITIKPLPPDLFPKIPAEAAQPPSGNATTKEAVPKR
jgi:parvulin-like peptidyl-prolyl isomerase